MQGQGSSIGSFPDTVNIEQESVPNISVMNSQISLNNMLNSADGRLSNYTVSSGESTCIHSSAHAVQSFSGWNSGESSSSRFVPMDQVNNDGMKMEHGLSSSHSVRAGGGHSSEMQFEPTNILFPGRLHIGHGGSHVSGPLALQGSSSNSIPQSVNLNAGHVNTRDSNCPNFYNLNRPEAGHRSSASSSGDGRISSGNSIPVSEENIGGTGSLISNWGSSCKRKALEGTSGQSSSGGSSSCFTQAENSIYHSSPPRYDASSNLSLSTPSQNSPSINPTDHLNPRFGLGVRGVASDAFPSSVAGNGGSSVRSFGRRVNPGQQHESVQFSLSSAGSARHSNLSSLHQSPRGVLFSDSRDLAAPVAASMSSSESQPHPMHISAFSRNMHMFPWNEASSSRAGSSSNTLVPGDRDFALGDDATVRSIPRSNVEHPLFTPATEMRTALQDPASWSLSPANIGMSGCVPSASTAGPSSSIHPWQAPVWIPPQSGSTSNQQRIPEVSPWSLFPSIDSESASHGGSFPPLPGPSVASNDTISSYAQSRQARRQQHRRSAMLLERQGEDFLGMPHSFRALAADIEGRHRLISEIRQVLSAMRRGENLRVEDYMLFDPLIYNGIADMAEMHDRHRDMRLDVDNMSYEELLALGERIGDVNTGLTEETILKSMKQRKYTSIESETSLDMEPCCVCQEEYVEEDDLGTLDCGHDFHTDCIKQWLMQKNMCPICKTTAMATRESKDS